MCAHDPASRSRRFWSDDGQPFPIPIMLPQWECCRDPEYGIVQVLTLPPWGQEIVVVNVPIMNQRR